MHIRHKTEYPLAVGPICAHWDIYSFLIFVSTSSHAGKKTIFLTLN